MAHIESTLYVSVGATSAMFTLRQRDVHVFGTARQTRTFHHCNLGQEPELSWQKALVYSLTMGIQLSTRLEDLTEELREISRMSREEQAERARAVAAREQRYADENAARLAAIHAKIDSGVFPFGKHVDEKFTEVPKAYLSWIVSQTFDTGSVMEYLAEAIRVQIGEIGSDFDATAYVGEVGKRLDIDVEVMKSTGFWREGYSGPEYVYVTTMRDSTSACLVVMSTTFRKEQGFKGRIRGTVKVHADYKGQAQTQLNRVKVM